MEILPGIHRLPGIRWSRAYLVEAETLAIFDSGLPWNTGTVLRYIEPIGRRPEEVFHILITHAHPDHAGAARRLALRTGAKIVAHRAEVRRRAGGELALNYMRLFGALPSPVPFLGRVPVGFGWYTRQVTRPQRLLSRAVLPDPLLGRHDIQRRDTSEQVGALPGLR